MTQEGEGQAEEVKETNVSIITVGGVSYFGRMRGREICDAIKLTAAGEKISPVVFKTWLKRRNIGETMRIVTGGADSLTIQDLTKAQRSQFAYLCEQFKQAQALALPIAENKAFDELCPKEDE